MEKDLEDFIRNRGVNEDIIDKMKNEKINMQALAAMNEMDLQEFVPAFGDRYAILDFCKNKTKNVKRESLLDKLRKKINKNKKREREEENNELDEEPRKVESKQRKPTRMIEIGWICNGTYVRVNKGGGTRRVVMNKNDNKFDIEQKALDLFFPEGMSTKGHITKYKYDIVDFKHNEFDRDLTIEEIYRHTNLTTLRFYLRTNVSTERRQDQYSPGPSTSRNLMFQFPNMDLPSESAAYEDSISSVAESAVYEDPIFSVAESVAYEDPTSPNDLTFSSSEAVKLHVTLHRGHIFSELIEQFTGLQFTELLNKFSNLQHLEIEVQIIGPNGEREKAQDGGGVTRDALSEFWDTFYNLCCEGTLYKVPVVNHLYNEERWKAIAAILVVGFIQVHYFPVKLARPFIEHALFQKTSVDLVETFLTVIGQSDAKLLKQALASFTDVPKDELSEIMESLECKNPNVNEKNIRDLLREMAHTFLIQKPMFIIDNWAVVFTASKCFNQNIINTIYEQNKINNKNIAQLLQLDVSNVKEDKVAGYLKRYIREAEVHILEEFLRFTTGANCITGNVISIQFNESVGIQRMPRAHTCSFILELSVNYGNFTDFRQEMDAVLKSNCWTMDLI